jgi:FkbM family methyltransferase
MRCCSGGSGRGVPSSTVHRTFAEHLFLGFGRVASALPPVRGKTRLCLALYRLLGLAGRHVRVRARLRRPVRYVAELDLHAWLQRVAFLTGGYEGDTVEFLLRLESAGGGARPGYLLDVGANVGLIAVPFALLARAGGGVRVVAVEAISDNLAVLRRNVELNGLGDAVKVVEVGLGEVARTVEIQVEGDLERGEGTGTANILPIGSTYECVRQTIEIRTLDELADCGEIPAGCSVVKIDTDGYDLKVLQGGVGFLRRERPVIFGEFSAVCLSWHGQSLADVLAFAKTVDYEVWKRIPRTWKFEVATEDSSFSEDLLLVPVEKRDAFRSVTH